MRNGASDKLTRSEDLTVEEVFTLLYQQVREELYPLGWYVVDESMDESMDESVALVARQYVRDVDEAKRLYDERGVLALLASDNARVRSIGLAITNDDYSILAM